MAEIARIYADRLLVPPPLDGEVRILTGGKFDWPFHEGHKKYLEALGDIEKHRFLFNLSEDIQTVLEHFRRPELWVGVTRDIDISRRIPGRPVVPEQIRAQQVAQLPYVRGVFLSDGDIFADSQSIKPQVVGYSTTTSDFESARRRETRELVAGLGIIGLVLPQLVDMSTSKALHDLFDRDPLILNIPFGDGCSFLLMYSDRMVLTPDESSIEIASYILNTLKNERRDKVRMVELGVGSGVFSTTMILNSGDLLDKIEVTDIDTVALAVADFNLTRAIAFKGMSPQMLSITKSDWFENIRGTYDVIYVNPPFFTENVTPPKEFENNPRPAMFPPYLTYHYEKIFSGLNERVKAGAMVVVRVPKTEDKVSRIKKTLCMSVNTDLVHLEDVTVGGGRFLILKYPNRADETGQLPDDR